MNELITGISMGFGFIWVLFPFRKEIAPFTKWIDIIILALLVYLIIVVRSNFIASITTFAGITVSIGLRMICYRYKEN